MKKYYMSVNRGDGYVIEAYRTKRERDGMVRYNSTARRLTRDQARHYSHGYIDMTIVIEGSSNQGQTWVKW